MGELMRVKVFSDAVDDGEEGYKYLGGSQKVS